MTSKGSGIRVVVYDENQKIQPIIQQSMIETIADFHHLPSCISFIQQNAQDERATVIVTTTIDDQTLQLFESLDTVEAILIISSREKDLVIDQLPSKVSGIYSQMEYLLRALFETLDLLELQLDADSLLFHRHRNGHDNLDFYFYYLWETYNPNKIISKKVLLDQSRIIFHYDQQIKPFMNDFNLAYKANEVLQWLEKYHHPFPYHVLVSNALRTHDQQILSLVRFFILDLVKQMKPLPVGPSYNQVYFGTKLPIAIVDRLEQQTENDIIAFQCFLPVTRSRNQAVLAATRPTRRRKIANVLFKIDATHALCVQLGEILLLNMATPFHVTRVSRNAGSGGVQQLITIVNIEVLNKSTRETLVGHFIQKQKKAGKTIDDFIQRTIPLVRPENSYEGQLVNRMMENNKNHHDDNSIPLYVVSVTKPVRPPLAVCKDELEADEHIRHGHWALAVDALSRIENPNVRVLNKHGCLLRERLHDTQAALECHQQALAQATDRGRAETFIFLGIVHQDSKEYAEAIKCYSQALQWFEKEPNKDPAMIARCLVGLGNAHWARRELNEALACAERALVLREHAVQPRNDFDIAACLGNMGNILHDQGDYARALTCARRAAEIISKCAPHGDPRIGAALNNLGAMYQACGDYVRARDYFQRALKILPDGDHPHRKSTLNNIARLNELENNARK